jgi:hypothetical protein
MSMMDEAAQAAQQPQQGQPQQGQPQQGQPQQGQPQQQAQERPLMKSPGQQDRRAVQDDAVVQAEMQEDKRAVSGEEAMIRQSGTDLDGGENDMYPWEKAASNESQKEYENAMQAMSTVIYDNDDTFKNLMGMIQNDDPVAGLIKAASTVVTEVDKQVDIPEGVIPALPAQAFDMLHELAVQQGAMEELSDQQVKTGTSAAQQMVMQAYGMDTEDFNMLTQGLTEKDVGTLQGIYKEATEGNGVT